MIFISGPFSFFGRQAKSIWDLIAFLFSPNSHLENYEWIRFDFSGPSYSANFVWALLSTLMQLM
jgi:hypothetical protein